MRGIDRSTSIGLPEVATWVSLAFGVFAALNTDGPKYVGLVLAQMLLILWPISTLVALVSNGVRAVRDRSLQAALQFGLATVSALILIRTISNIEYP